MKWNFPTKSSYTNSYPERWDFTFWVKINSTIIILPHPWKYLQTSTLKSYYIFKPCGDLAQTLLVTIIKGFKIPRIIYNNKKSETILTMLTLTPLYKKMKLSKLKLILTCTLWVPGTPRIWLFVPITYKNKLQMGKLGPNTPNHRFGCTESHPNS